MANVGDFFAFGSIIVLATLTIYSASYASLRMPREAKRRWRKARGEEDDDEDEDDDEEDEEDEVVDRLTAQDAYLFPILGSVVLFTLYLAFTFLDKEMINSILGAYLALMGVGAVAKVLSSGIKFGLGTKVTKGLVKWKISMHKGKKEYASLGFTVLDLVALVLGLGLQVLQLYKPFWILSNLVALSFAFGAVSLMRLDSFWTGSALLALLFFYDVWWVFGSNAVFGANVMVTVATSFDAPIKITFPRTFLSPLYTLQGKDFMLLGLGDIVLPGIFVALSLRWDYHRALKRVEGPPKPEMGWGRKGKGWGRPYFRATLGAYVLGLITTITMMHQFKAAQPALLYLSPACIIAVCFTGWRRGEWKKLWAFDDASDDEPSKDKKKDEEVEAEDERSVEQQESEKPRGSGLRNRGTGATSDAEGEKE
ncbi:BZ3500_MvSof-1268-A1-R1_Chr2-1g04582 [Microbotryum saponariae]|uniref:BZ3500_MvSof-1268-A1-R1_Chr2-1g04582 protein n=1 Tax=Microbotryum saponariae TaxID=289078 RepID=A0A2X0MAB8_9BASI|nr:BZ3500_MvSof-1268-A1-R1_Chr2-1g04582 [Microbotryum saponariae]SCZ92084.1 BZ3501_MvSof-1269-A2-R1_Chr2-1g04238 [Microbotryum saponariae]